MREYHVLEMESEELNRTVKIYLYLPASYEHNDRFYPVVYMHDGQNLFDDSIAYKGSWKILESMEDPSMPELIIVGINSTTTRSNELLPLTFDFDGEIVGGDAKKYYQFIISELKPMIDQRFRTFKSAKYTAIMGSSFGGVSSLYAASRYSNFFSRFGCLSNAHYVLGEPFYELMRESDLSKVRKLYMDVGTEETSGASISSEDYVKSNEKLYEILQEKLPEEDLFFQIVEGAKHDEDAWSKRFKDIIKFLFEVK
jgi:predicted alpha/beta superfamily hydrolase